MKIVFLVHILVMDNFTRSKQVLTVFSSGENNEFVFLKVNTFMLKLIRIVREHFHQYVCTPHTSACSIAKIANFT